jgi:cytidylate kinase
MPVITINGPVGCGSIHIGQIVARKLHLDFVDRLVLTEAAKLLEKPVGALIDKEQRIERFRDRLGRFIQTMLERSAISGEMYAGGALMTLPPEAYASLGGDQSSNSGRVGDKEFIEATTTVVKALYQKGDVIIIGRAANMILADSPGVFHVGLFAPPEVRVQILMHQENLEREEAEVMVEELEQAHVEYYRKFFQVHPNEPSLYHIFLNMGKLQPQTAANIIAHAADDVVSARQSYGDDPSHAESFFSAWGEPGKQ